MNVMFSKQKVVRVSVNFVITEETKLFCFLVQYFVKVLTFDTELEMTITQSTTGMQLFNQVCPAEF